MIDVALLAILAVVAWCVSSEGAWGAAFMLLTVLFSGLLAMNFFEPVADFLESTISSDAEWHYRWDIIALIGSFAVFVLLIRTALEYIMPTLVLVHSLAFDVIRWVCGLATGYVVMAFFLTALHTAPFPRTFLGFTPERANFFNMAAPDRQWLGFTQYVSERVFFNDNLFDGPEFAVGSYQFPEQLRSAHPRPGEEAKLPVWPSFPIRYAARREEIEMGGGGGASTESAPPTPSGPGQRPNF